MLLPKYTGVIVDLKKIYWELQGCQFSVFKTLEMEKTVTFTWGNTPTSIFLGFFSLE